MTIPNNTGIQEEAQQYMDWKIFTRTTSLLSSTKQLFILKHSAGIAATGRNMVRQKERTTDECPRYGAPDEHIEHIIQCTNDDAGKIFLTALEEINI